MLESGFCIGCFFFCNPPQKKISLAICFFCVCIIFLSLVLTGARACGCPPLSLSLSAVLRRLFAIATVPPKTRPTLPPPLMSSVEPLPGASGPERTAAARTRAQPPGRTAAVCRSLFGPIDHDELRREMSRRLRECGDRDRRRWNFDFQTETPLEGEFEWESSSARESPGFYRETVQGRGKGRPPAPQAVCPPQAAAGETPGRLHSQENNQENRSVNVHPSGRANKHSASRRPGTGTANNNNNTHITGQGRRHNTHRLSVCVSAPLSLSVCRHTHCLSLSVCVSAPLSLSGCLSLPLRLSVCCVSVCVCLFVPLAVCLCVPLAVPLAVCLAVCVSLWLAVCASGCLCVWLSVRLAVWLCVWLSGCASGCLAVRLAVWLCVWLSGCASGCLAVCPSGWLAVSVRPSGWLAVSVPLW
uniref:Cyclin-dependent kinase inhibitor domain-containing protein n=1 Tax=Callorhinchus milii TaxID=7868 RepID=A0A4W3HSV9_CALMI